MLKNFMRDIALSIQAKSGVTPSLFVWLAIVVLALITAFAFLCVAGYTWLALQLGTVFAGLAMAGVFLVIALIAVTAAAPWQLAGRLAIEMPARAGVIGLPSGPPTKALLNVSGPMPEGIRAL